MIGWVFDKVPVNANRLARRNGWKVRMWEKAAWVKLINEIAGPGPFHRDRVRLAITMHRSRLQDPDNRVGCLKPLVDALRHTNWLFDDSEAWCELHVFEQKCKRGDESTWIVWDRIEARTLTPTPAEARK